MREIIKKKIMRFLGPLILSAGSVIWGVSFVAQSEGGQIGTLAFQGIRLSLACVTIGVTLLLRRLFSKADKKTERYLSAGGFFKKNKKQLIGGLICGLTLSAASGFQQWGIDLIGTGVSAGRAGFLTVLYIVIVPVFGLFMGKKIGIASWISVVIAVGGLYLISVKPGSGAALSKGDVVLLIGALLYAVQILAVDRHLEHTDPLMLSFLEFFVAAVIGVVLMLIFDRPDPEQVKRLWPALAYAGVLSGGVAFTLQVYGQKFTPPVLASLIMSMESVFSALADFIIRKNTLSSREIAGCAVMFLAITVAQLPKPRSLNKRTKKSDKTRQSAESDAAIRTDADCQTR